jgi:hypothetical protein
MVSFFTAGFLKDVRLKVGMGRLKSQRIKSRKGTTLWPRVGALPWGGDTCTFGTHPHSQAMRQQRTRQGQAESTAHCPQPSLPWHGPAHPSCLSCPSALGCSHFSITEAIFTFKSLFGHMVLLLLNKYRDRMIGVCLLYEMCFHMCTGISSCVEVHVFTYTRCMFFDEIALTRVSQGLTQWHDKQVLASHMPPGRPCSP